LSCYSEQVAERTRKAAAGSGQYASSVEDAEEQRKVCFDPVILWWVWFPHRSWIQYWPLNGIKHCNTLKVL